MNSIRSIIHFCFRIFLLFVIGTGSLVWAADNNSIAGRDEATNIVYFVGNHMAGKFIVRIFFPSGTEIRSEIDDNAKYIEVQVINSRIGRMGLSPAEIAGIKNFSQRWWPQSRGRKGEILSGLLAWLAEAPANVSIDTVQGVQPQAYTSLCRQAGQVGTASYDTRTVTVEQEVVIGTCFDTASECLGRCGAGCDGSPGDSIQRITQDCLNHDQCFRDTGSNTTPPCTDEFTATADDFLFADDCASFSDSWVDSYGQQWNLIQLTLGIIIGNVDTALDCGVWNVRGTRDSDDMALTAMNPIAQEGCCSSFTYTGVCDDCDTAAGEWTNVCGSDGTFSMSRLSGNGTWSTLLPQFPGTSPTSQANQ